jgi:hypothetical protein
MDVSWNGNKEWHQIGQIYNSTTNELYIVLDGQLLIGSSNSYSPLDPTELVIGGEWGSGYNWDGLINNFRIYNR